MANPEISKRTQTSATFAINPPQILQDYDCSILHLDNIQFAIREVPHDGDGGNQSEKGADATVVDIKHDSANTGSATHSQQLPNQGTVDKLKAGRKYRLRLRANYNTGDSVEGREVEFVTNPYTGMHAKFCTEYTA